MKARNPWAVELTRYLSWSLFSLMKEVVLKSSTSFGIMLQQSEKEVVITFTNIGCVLRDFETFSRVARSEISSYYFQKPLQIKYIKRKSEIIFKCHYSFENEFGYVFSLASLALNSDECSTVLYSENVDILTVVDCG